MKSSEIKVELFALSGSACQVSHGFSHGFIRVILKLMSNFAEIPEDFHRHSRGICSDGICKEFAWVVWGFVRISLELLGIA